MRLMALILRRIWSTMRLMALILRENWEDSAQRFLSLPCGKGTLYAQRFLTKRGTHREAYSRVHT